MNKTLFIVFLILISAINTRSIHAQPLPWVTESSGNFFSVHIVGIAVVNENIYALETEDTNSGAISYFEIFDPNTNTCSKITPTGNYIARTKPAVAVFDNKIYVIGGKDDSGYVSTGGKYSILQRIVGAHSRRREHSPPVPGLRLR